MRHKNLCSIYQRLAQITRTKWKFKFIHTNCNFTEKPVHLLRHYEVGIGTTRVASILQGFNDSSLLLQGRQVHGHVVINGSTGGLLGSKILGMYVLCGSFEDATKLFYQLQLSYSLPWNWMIRGCTMMGLYDFALMFYFKMLGWGTCPDKYTFPYVIKACGGLNSLSLGKLVYGTIRNMGFEEDVFVGSSLIKLFADCGCIDDAHMLFDKMPQKDCVLWNVMLNGYVKNGNVNNGIRVFMQMRNSEIKPNSVTFAGVLSICASESMMEFGIQLHGLVIRCGLDFDSPVANTLLAMYSKCQLLFEARNLFDNMPKTDLVSWNGIISGYVQNGFMGEASYLFQEMINAGVKPDSITFSSFLPSLTESLSSIKGKEIHGYIVRHSVPLDVFLKSALIDIYFKCRDVEMAKKLFNQNTTVDIVLCTSMISGYVLNGMNNDSLEMFRWLLELKMTPNSITLASILPACAGLAALNLGKELHGHSVKNGIDGKCFVGSAITDMYAKCGRLDLAHLVFRRIYEKDAVCWNSMITSCSQNGKPEEAVDLFRQMGMGGIKYDCVSISAALSACANLPALHYGKEIHSFMIRSAFISDLFGQSALIDMYAKCGNLNFARGVFDMMQEKNEVSWNSIISAYGNHGRLKESLTLFHKMLETGIQPDHVTFLGMISACGHAGQVDDGIRYFRLMTEEYGIQAQMEHYACMVDLFGRAGRISEAFDTIRSMPLTPDAGVWGTLLGACRVHGNVEIAEVASRHLFDLDPQNSGYYILLSHIHADAGQWGSVLQTRSLMKERGVQKVPGYSWIDINNTTHMFVAADTSHPQSVQIYLLLKNILMESRKEGYVPQVYLPMHPQILSSRSAHQT